MYFVFKHGKKLTSLGKYRTYEQARSAARKYIRATEGEYDPLYDSTNPALCFFGYSVKRVV